MNRAILYGMPAVTGVGLLAASAALVRADSADSNAVNAAASSPPAAPCQLEMTHAEYGFQCLGSSSSGSTLEPVSFVGTVSGDGHGFFEAFGTFNSSNGSLPLHLAGRGTLLQRCFGHVDYTTTEIQLPNGGTVPLPPISFDYAVVHGGDELMGAGVAPAGVTGDPVPRLACRLVRVR